MMMFFQAYAGASVSLKKKHIVTLRFSEDVKDHANYNSGEKGNIFRRCFTNLGQSRPDSCSTSIRKRLGANFLPFFPPPSSLVS